MHKSPSFLINFYLTNCELEHIKSLHLPSGASYRAFSMTFSPDRKRSKEKRAERKKQIGPAILVTQLGLSMALSILFCFAIGYYLDKWLNTKGLFILIFIILGVLGGGYNAYRLIMETMNLDEKNKTKDG
jgi:ATP synthase protein I